MVIDTLKEVKERGIRNIIEENIELLKELGVAGYLKVKTDQIKEGMLGKAEEMRKMIIGKEKIGTKTEVTGTPKEVTESYTTHPEEFSEEVSEVKVSGKFKTGM